MNQAVVNHSSYKEKVDDALLAIPSMSLVTDMEHFGIYAEVTDPKGQRFVIIHEDYKGKLPEGTVIKTKSDFPLVFLRTQTFEFNEDNLS